MQLDLALLRTFVAAAETLSFTRAAGAVHRSPAAVSTHIRKLEEALGTPLFRRDTRNIALTPAGERLLGYARRLAGLHDEAVEAIRQPEVTGRVTIGVPDDYVSALLTPALRRFGALFPRVEVEVACEQTPVLLPLLADSSLDLALVTRMPGAAGSFLRLEPMVWVAAPDSDAPRRSPLPVALYEPGSVARSHALAALDGAGLSYRSAYSSPSLLGLLAVVEAGLAVAALARCSVPPGLTILADPLPPIATLEVVLARSAASHRPPCDALAEVIRQSVPETRSPERPS